MKIGEIFRYAADRDPVPVTVDGFPNYFYQTHTPGATRAQLERGINSIKPVKGPDGRRTPAILISSSPHKIGSAETPWQDFFDPDEGHVRYFGDAKAARKDPAEAIGNKALLAAKRLHAAMEPEVRRTGPPIVLFKRMRVNGKVKGFPAFQGIGIIERAELVAQYDAKTGTSFPNFAYDIAVLSLTSEHEEFDWRWISDRRNGALSIEETEQYAPASWMEWVAGGTQVLPRVKRRITKILTTPTEDQRSPKGSKEGRALRTVYEFYEGRKHRFELLAARIVERILESNGGRFRFGWVTPPSSDGGADFIGRYDIGSGFSNVRQVVLGQAKCESPSSTTSGKDVARTVARLRRGWFGAYVTLGAFSNPVQREIIEDEYPILLVPGERVAREVVSATTEAGYTDIVEYLRMVDAEYEQLVIDRRPEEILRE